MGLEAQLRQLGAALAQGWQNSSCQPGPPRAEGIIQAGAGRRAGRQQDTGGHGRDGGEQAGQGGCGRHSKRCRRAWPCLCPAHTSQGVRQTDRDEGGKAAVLSHRPPLSTCVPCSSGCWASMGTSVGLFFFIRYSCCFSDGGTLKVLVWQLTRKDELTKNVVRDGEHRTPPVRRDSCMSSSPSSDPHRHTRAASSRQSLQHSLIPANTSFSLAAKEPGSAAPRG